MNTPVLVAAMIAALPICAAAQEAGPGSASTRTPAGSSCTGIDETPRAASALPARASTKPEPQLGSVASNARVPSHAETPSMRAMRAARAKEAGRAADAPAGAIAACAPPATENTTQGEVRKR